MLELALWVWVQAASSLTVRPQIGTSPLAVQVIYRVSDVKASDEAMEVTLMESETFALRRSNKSLDTDDNRAIMSLQWENVGPGEYEVVGCILPAKRCLTQRLIVK